MKILLAQGGNALAALPLRIIANLTLADCAPTHIAAGELVWDSAKSLKSGTAHALKRKRLQQEGQVLEIVQLCVLPHSSQFTLRIYSSFLNEAKLIMKTDAQVLQGVIAKLKCETSVNAGDIGIEVKEGNVTLIGTVKTWAERDLALLCSWGAPGIRNIAHNIIVTN